MIFHRYSKLTAAALLCGTAFLAMPAAVLADAKQDIRESYMEAYGKRGMGGGGALQVFAQIFQQYDKDGNGIEEAEIDSFERVQTAMNRAGIASQNLRFDLNGDLRITREEVTEVFETQQGRYRRAGQMNEAQKKQMQRRFDQQIAQIFKPDLDGNGVIEGSEIYAPAFDQGRNEDYMQPAFAFVRVLLKADPNNDGKLTEAEGSLLLSQSLDGVDDDIAKAMAEKQSDEANGIRNTCPKFEVAKDSTFVVFGAYEGTSLSSVSVAGQDTTTHAATLMIEEGQTPITLVVASYSPMIWRFTGATNRLAKVIISGGLTENGEGKVAAAVSGLDRSKITFLAAGECFNYFHDPKSSEALITKAVLRKITGKEPDALLGGYEVDAVKLPSGKGTEQDLSPEQKQALVNESGAQHYTVGKDGKLAQISEAPERGASMGGAEGELFRFNPTGLMDFKLDELVSNIKPEKYGVLPEHAGLMQLQAEGKIEPMPGDRGGWKIKAKIRFPTGLNGAHSTSFFLPKGVPEPDGKPGHSCVFSEEKAAYVDESSICAR
jgi:hypothetical protein